MACLPVKPFAWAQARARIAVRENAGQLPCWTCVRRALRSFLPHGRQQFATVLEFGMGLQDTEHRNSRLAQISGLREELDGWLRS